MLRRLYDWTLSLAAHPRALWALAFVAFIEASVFPIPPDVLMIAMIIAAPSRAFLIAAVATLASVAGGLLGYGIGAFRLRGRWAARRWRHWARAPRSRRSTPGSTISASGRCWWRG
jgi:membrane protein YqaA with SNARE-associated domain